MHAEDYSTATVEVIEADSRLRVHWQADTRDTFQSILSSFRCTFPRHGQAVWLADEQTWSLRLSEKPRLMRWVHFTFTRDNVTWRHDRERERMQSSSSSCSSASVLDPALRAAFDTLYVLPTAPPEVVLAATRALAKLYHPDHGGDHEAMVAVNQAAELVRRHADERANTHRAKARSSSTR